jgi:apolipoprotein N-acyltransferase
VTAQGHLRLPPAIALAVLAGYLTRLAFPDPGWWPLAPVGVALWAVASAGRSWRTGSLVGLAYGLALMLPLLSWSGVYVGAFPWVALAVLQSLYLVLLGALLPRAQTLGRAAPFVVAALWVGQEALRDRTPYGGFPWGRLAFSQSESPLAPLAALGGAPLVTFGVALAGALLGSAVLRLLRPSPARRVRALRPVLGAVAVGCCGLLVPLPTSGTPVQVAGIQGDVPQPGLEFNAERAAVLGNHASLTARLGADVAAGRAPAPDVVVWPENASDIDPFRQADARATIDDAVRAVDAPTLVGAVLRRDDGRLTNASIAWTPQAGPGARYAKRHPVPFGEYIPNRDFFRMFSDKVDLVAREYAPGDAVGRIDLGPARLGIAICFEVAYDGLVRDTVRDGADLLVVQTNNATFGYTDEAVQQLAMSQLRAIEHGRSVAHVSTVGVSAMIAPDGRILTRSELFTPAVLQAALPLRTSLTLADRLGGAPELVLTALGLLALALPWRRRRGDRRADTLAEPAPAPAGGLVTTEVQ